MKFPNITLLSLLLGANASLAEVTLVADQPYPLEPAAFTVDPELNTPAARGLTGGRQLRQTFQLSQRISVEEIIVGADLAISNSGLSVRIYEVADTLAGTWTPGNLVKTITIDTTVEIPDTTTTLGIQLTGDDVFTLEPTQGTAGYGIEFQDGGGSLGVIRHTNSGTDHYPEGLFYKEDGNISAAHRDLGISIAGTRDTTLGPSDPPGFAIQPRGTSVFPGNTIELSVLSDSHPDAGTVTYQWKQDGAIIPDATLSTLIIPAATVAEAGDYTVELTNDNGTSPSQIAKVYIVSAIPGLVFNTGVDASGALLADGAIDPHYELIENADSGSPDAFVIDSTVAPVNGTWSPNTADSKWIGPRFTSGSSGGTYIYRTTFDLTGYDPATVAVAGDWASDNNALDILVNGISTGLAKNDYAQTDPFNITPGYFVSGTNTLDFVIRNSSSGSTGFKMENFRVGGESGSGPLVPVILADPKNVEVSFGSTTTFSALADGAAILNYQWRLNGTNIPGANEATYTIGTVDDSHVGEYEVVVSNTEGSDTSKIATLALLVEPPVFVAQPINQYVTLDEAVTFSVEVEGRMPMSYQWRRDGNVIPGATSSEFSIDPVTQDYDGATYDVVVSNVDGSLPSEIATLRVFQDRVPGVFATGVDNEGLLLTGGEIDPHYALTLNANGPETEPLVLSTIHPAWATNTNNSRWIGPSANAQGQSGTYTYQTTFDLTGFDLNTITLVGSLAVDDGILEVRLNGNFIDAAASATFSGFSDFEVISGFVYGVNTLEFDVRNGGSGSNSTGFHLRSLGAFGVDLNLAPPAITDLVYSASPKKATLTWSSSPNATYIIEASTDLTNWLELEDSWTSDGETTTYIDTTGVLLGDKVFYHVKVAQ